MDATWSDLPPKVVDLVAHALLRLWYASVHQSRTTPGGELAADRWWKRRSVPAGSVAVLDAGLVDAPTWAAAATTAAVCRQLRGALQEAVGGLTLQVPSLESTGDYVEVADEALPAPWKLQGRSVVNRYTVEWSMGTAGLFGCGGGSLRRWLFFFLAAVDGGSDDQAASLTSFVRSCPKLRAAVEVWDCYGLSGVQSTFILRCPATTPPTRRRGVSAAGPPERRPPGAPDDEAPLRLAVSQHLGVPVRVYYDHPWVFQVSGVAAAAAGGGPALHRRATLRTGTLHFKGTRQDDWFFFWDYNDISRALERARLSWKQNPPRTDKSGTPAGSV